ncbi:MAG: hypothetical protein FGM43_10185 [Sinobacteraceae bacterium]|nr:hypothetical protein [Nevskiaceae bacterium]
MELHYPDFLELRPREGRSLPDYLQQEFDAYLKCVRLEQGFLRLRCDSCSPRTRVTGLLGEQGIEVRRGEWAADRHVKQVRSERGRWVVLLKDGRQVAVSRRRLAEVKERWWSTRYL